VTPAVVATGLVKEFEKGRYTLWQRLRREPDRRTRFRAVDEIDLRVETGEIFGLLGPNGAGKTTTMKMLSTLLEPTSGTIEVLGIDVARHPREVRARLGAMLSGERSLYWKLTGRENLEYFAALYHVPPGETKARIANVLAAVKLADRADDYVERYSTGMRQRLALARALLPNPPLVVLDEPTVGLDPKSVRLLKDLLRREAKSGVTVFLSTHSLDIVQELASRIGIIHRGRLIGCGTLAALRTQAAVDGSLEEVFLRLTEPGGEDFTAPPPPSADGSKRPPPLTPNPSPPRGARAAAARCERRGNSGPPAQSVDSASKASTRGRSTS